MARYQEFPLTFEKGFIGEVEESVLQQGQASTLTNWEPTAEGGLRARNAWSAISTTGLPTNYKTRGWGTVAVAASEEVSGGATIVQTDTVQTDGSDALTGNPGSVSLSGITIGNLLLVGFTLSDATGVGLPSVGSITSGFTLIMSSDGIETGGNDTRSFLYGKIATSTSQTCSVTAAGDTPSVLTLAMSEVSGVTSITPTATDNDAGTGALTLSCTSVSGSGVAVTLWEGVSTGSPGSWTTTPGAGWTNWGASFFDGAVPINSDINIKTYSASPVTDTGNSFSTGDTIAIMAIFDTTVTSSSTPAEFYILLAVATDTGYSIYRIPRNSIQAGTWELVDSEACTDTSGFVSMSVNSGELVWSASTMSNPRYVVLSTLTGNDLTDLSSKAGRATCSHKNRMFVAGDTTNPSRLRWSGIGTPHTFGANDFLDIGGDDGEAIEDLVSVEGLLLICKTNRLYLLSGSGIESFFINELPAGTASTGRATVRTPYGTIVAGPAEIWVVQGGGVDPLSRPLGADYSVTGLVSTAYAQDHALICDSGTNSVYRVNLVTGSWSKELVTAGENDVYHLFSLQNRLYYGVENSATEVGGTRRLSSSRSFDELTNATDYAASTGKIALLGPVARYSPRFVFLQMRLQDPTKPNHLFVTITTNQGSKTESILVNSEVQREKISMGPFKGSEWVQVSYAHDSSPTQSAIDIEYGVIATILEDQ